MASEVDICNLALARLGDDATVASIDPPEGSAQAEHCARFYPMARDTLLEAHNWRFTLARASMAELAVTPPAGWAYAYAQPTGAVRLISVLAGGAPDDSAPQDFESEIMEDGSQVIYSNTPDAVLRYTLRPTDTTKFSPLFIDTLTMLLASHLAGPVLKGDAGASMSRYWLGMYVSQLANAKLSDTRQRQITPPHSVSWMSGR